MKSFGAIILLYVAVCLVQGFPEEKDAKNGHAHHDHDGPMMCQGKNLTIPDSFKTAMHGCMNKTKPADGTDKPDKEKMKNGKSCCAVCTGQALGFLDTAGKPVKDKFTAGLKEIFPEAALKDLTTELTSCLEKSEKSLVLKEGDCSSYDEMIECGMKGIKKVCKIE